MSGRINKEANLQSATARARLKRGRQPHWWTIVPGRAHLGYQRWLDDPAGRWLLRQYASGRYSVETLGWADNGGREGLAFEDALPLAQKKLGAAPTTRLTVRRAMALYVEFLEAQGKRTRDVARCREYPASARR